MNDKNQRDLQLLHRLAQRLPWIVVLAVLLTAITVFIQLYFGMA